MRKLLILSALLGLGCDDPEVVAKVESALVHGGVQAQLVCQEVFCGGESFLEELSSVQYFFKANLFMDGSSIVEFMTDDEFPWTISFNKRGEPVQATVRCQGTSGLISSFSLVAADGELSATGSSDCYSGLTIDPQPIVNSGTNCDPNPRCTGFNLEAFGVTP